ncbi:pentapeptide repeat-containing protein [Yersinia alsatica]|uniref:pentapeptide repeat-containing protein n=1 Tax=Yersinia alsatica TaxID=2890317 RepID=UPI0032ED2D38
MARNKKNKNAFSYNNHDVASRNFINKNFNKTHSYHSNFFQSKFTNTSFIGASLKWCNFTGSVFQSSLLRGVLFRGGSLRHVVFKECIINSCNLDKCKTEGLKFDKCYIVSSNNLIDRLQPSQIIDSKTFNSFPENDEFNPVLIDVIQQLRTNDFVRRSSVLHRKLNKIDTITLTYLLDRFDEKFLIEQLPIVCMKIEREFHTISYIDQLLKKQI